MLLVINTILLLAGVVSAGIMLTQMIKYCIKILKEQDGNDFYED